MKTEVKALFKKFNANDKKDVIEFELKGDLSGDQLLALHKLKGGQVYIQISSSQMDIDDIEEDDDLPGMEYSVGSDGVVQVDSSQLSLEDVATPENVPDPDELPSEEGLDGEKDDTGETDGDVDPPAQNIADIDQERKRRGRPKKTESDTVPAEDPADKLDDLPAASSDDDLPF